jgi:nucleoid DNA-binding protein
MNQKELINTLAKEQELPKDFAERILKSMLNTIVSKLKKGDVVRLRNFGTFQIKKSHRKYRVKFDDSDNIFKHYG